MRPNCRLTTTELTQTTMFRVFACKSLLKPDTNVQCCLPGVERQGRGNGCPVSKTHKYSFIIPCCRTVVFFLTDVPQHTTNGLAFNKCAAIVRKNSDYITLSLYIKIFRMKHSERCSL